MHRYLIAYAMLCLVSLFTPAWGQDSNSPTQGPSNSEPSGFLQPSATLSGPTSPLPKELLSNAAAEDLELAGGTWDVSSSGAFKYTIPISLPAGRKGLAPQLSVVYAAPQQNGLMGIGFVLTGIPAILRVSLDDGINYDGNDTFAASFSGGETAFI